MDYVNNYRVGMGGRGTYAVIHRDVKGSRAKAANLWVLLHKRRVERRNGVPRRRVGRHRHGRMARRKVAHAVAFYAEFLQHHEHAT